MFLGDQHQPWLLTGWAFLSTGNQITLVEEENAELMNSLPPSCSGILHVDLLSKYQNGY
jgi:hypothetical protein